MGRIMDILSSTCERLPSSSYEIEVHKQQKGKFGIEYPVINIIKPPKCFSFGSFSVLHIILLGLLDTKAFVKYDEFS